MIIVFVVDTSISMNQQTSAGNMTVLDCAKALIEHFLKVRARTAPLAMRSDRYFLTSTADSLDALKATWRDSFGTFVSQLKTLVAKDLGDIGVALQRTFDSLNQYRLHTGMDSFGCGRTPTFLEPTLIIALSDGGALLSNGVVAPLHLTLPATNEPGSEFVSEPFRWDQRLYALLLPFAAIDAPDSAAPPGAPAATTGTTATTTTAATATSTVAAASVSPLAPMCEVTGGKCITAKSLRHALQLMENLATRHTSVGVNVLLEPAAPIPGADAFTHGLRRKLLIRPNSPHPWWPIPESYSRDALAGKKQLPPRTALPTVRFATNEANPAIPDNFPFDKYELEASPLTEHMLRTTRGGCLTCTVPGSGARAGREEPFGYLKASTTSGSVSLFVLPYNYPRLFQLINELRTTHRMVPTVRWRSDFEQYYSTIPQYYAPALRNALRVIGANLVPEHWDGLPPRHVLVGLEQAKAAAVLNAAKRMAELAAVREAIASGASTAEVAAAGAAAAAAVTSVPEADAILANIASLGGPQQAGTTLTPASGESVPSLLSQRSNAASTAAAAAAAASATTTNSSASTTASSAAASVYKTDRTLDAIVTAFGASHDVDTDGLPLAPTALQHALAAGGNHTAPPSTALPLVPAALTRDDLLLALDRLRTAARQPPARAVADALAAARLSMPIAMMGDYSEAMVRNPPLRDVDPALDSRPMFGNPFRTIQKRMPGDDVDLALMDGVGGHNGPPTRRARPATSNLRESTTPSETTPATLPPPSMLLPPPTAPTAPATPTHATPSPPPPLQQQPQQQQASKLAPPKPTLPPPSGARAPTQSSSSAVATVAAAAAAAAAANRKRLGAPESVSKPAAAPVAKAARVGGSAAPLTRSTQDEDEEEEEDDAQPEFDSLASAFRAGTSLLQNVTFDEDSSSPQGSPSSPPDGGFSPTAPPSPPPSPPQPQPPSSATKKAAAPPAEPFVRPPTSRVAALSEAAAAKAKKAAEKAERSDSGSDSGSGTSASGDTNGTSASGEDNSDSSDDDDDDEDDDDGSDDDDDESSSGRADGSDGSGNSDSSKSSEGAVVALPAKRPRGRPPKSTAKSVSSAPKRAKTAAPTKTKTATKAKATEKRPVGRPPKSSSAKTAGAAAPPTKPTKK